MRPVTQHETSVFWYALLVYAPYLHGRQAELTAVAESASRLGTPQQIIPLVEPVVAKVGPLLRTLDRLKSVDAACYLIVNPYRGKLLPAAAQAAWTTALN